MFRLLAPMVVAVVLLWPGGAAAKPTCQPIKGERVHDRGALAVVLRTRSGDGQYFACNRGSGRRFYLGYSDDFSSIALKIAGNFILVATGEEDGLFYSESEQVLDTTNGMKTSVGGTCNQAPEGCDGVARDIVLTARAEVVFEREGTIQRCFVPRCSAPQVLARYGGRGGFSGPDSDAFAGPYRRGRSVCWRTAEANRRTCRPLLRP